MAFPTASGYNNFPNGNAFPTIFAQEMIKNLHENLVSSAITNTTYEGLISAYGDKVNIVKANEVTVSAFARGGTVTDQYLNDDQVQLVIDQSAAFSFVVENVEKRLSHLDWASKQLEEAAFAVQRYIDTDILEYMRDNATTVASLGVVGTTKSVGTASGDDYTALDYINHGNTKCDENLIPMGNRFWVAGPAFYEELGKEATGLSDASKSGLSSAAFLNNTLMFGGAEIHGFKMYKTTNMPTSSAADPIVLFGHRDATSTAMALIETRIEYIPGTFVQRYMGQVAYGRKVVRPEMLFLGVIAY